MAKGTREVRQTVPVTLRALIQRINRKLEKEGQLLKRARGSPGTASPGVVSLGDYFIVNTRRNFVEETHVDPVKLGREQEILAPWEHVVEDEGVVD